VFIKAFLRHLHNFLPRRGWQGEEGVSESEDGATGMELMGGWKAWREGGWTLSYSPLLGMHFMCTTYETLTPLRINYARKRQPLHRLPNA